MSKRKGSYNLHTTRGSFVLGQYKNKLYKRILILGLATKGCKSKRKECKQYFAIKRECEHCPAIKKEMQSYKFDLFVNK